MSNITEAKQWIRANKVELEREILRLMINDVDNSRVYPEYTVDKIVRSSLLTPIKWYTYWSKTVLGYYKNGMFYINRRNSLSVANTIMFLIHESCHANGLRHDRISFWRRNRKQVENSLVYRIGYKARDMYKGKE